MMRKMFSVALLATLACVFGLSANAGVTIDVVFQDTGTNTLTLTAPGDPGAPGCTGPLGAFHAGRCMDVMLTNTDRITFVSGSVGYDTDNGLAVSSISEFWGTSFMQAGLKFCTPFAGIVDNGSSIQSFDCNVGAQANPPSLPASTYRMGTIVWDTSATTAGSETIQALIIGGVDGVSVVLNGVIVDISGTVALGVSTLNIVPEPGTASLLGLGLVGLILAGRRSRA